MKEDGPQIDMAKLNVNQALFKEFEKLMKGTDIDRDVNAYAKSLDDVEKALEDAKDGMGSINEYQVEVNDGEIDGDEKGDDEDEPSRKH